MIPETAAPTGPSNPPRRRSAPWMLDVVVGVVVGVVAFAFIVKPLPVDPMIYLEGAQNPLEADLNHWTARIGLLIPVWLVSLVFGYSEATFYVVPLIAVSGFAAATSALGRLVVGRWVGVGAALVATAGPFVLPYATMLLPDIAATALLTTSLVLVLLCGDAPPDRQRKLLRWAGALFGLSYLVREFSLFHLPALLVVASIMGIPWRRLTWLLGASLLAPVLEVVAGLLLWGDPIARITALFERGTGNPQRLAENQEAAIAQANPFASFRIFLDLLWSPWAGWYGRLLTIGSAVAAVWAVATRHRRRMAAVVWMVIPWMVLAIAGTVRPDPGSPLIRLVLERYWAALIPPISIGSVAVAAVLVSLFQGNRSGRIAARLVAVTVTVALIGLGVVASFERRGDWFVRFGNDDLWQMRSAFSAVPGELVVPARFLDLIELYANDPWGRPVGPIRVIADTDTTGVDPTPWVLVLEDSVSRRGVKPPIASPPVSFGIMDADSSTRWVLLAPGEGTAEVSRAIAADAGWTARLVDDGSWSDPMPLPPGDTVLGADDQLVVYDSSAPFADPPAEGGDIGAGELVEIRVELELEGGSTLVFCRFHHQDTEPESVLALVATPGGTLSGELVSYCRAPAEGGPFQVRTIVQIQGPAVVDVEDGTVIIHPDV